MDGISALTMLAGNTTYIPRFFPVYHRRRAGDKCAKWRRCPAMIIVARFVVPSNSEERAHTPEHVDVP
jgi:hypothetical protein